MSKTAKSSCPKCGEELIVEHIIENHKVHNGVGMQTAARDEWDEVVEMSCDHAPHNYTQDEWDDMLDEAAENYEDEYEGLVDHLKDVGEI